MVRKIEKFVDDTYEELEIRNFGLGSIIWDVALLDKLKVELTVPKCAVALALMASNSLHNHGGQK